MSLSLSLSLMKVRRAPTSSALKVNSSDPSLMTASKKSSLNSGFPGPGRLGTSTQAALKFQSPSMMQAGQTKKENKPEPREKFLLARPPPLDSSCLRRLLYAWKNNPPLTLLECAEMFYLRRGDPAHDQYLPKYFPGSLWHCLAHLLM